MAASYPTSTKTFATRASGDVIQPAHVNDLQDEVVALEQGLRSGLAHSVLPVATALYDLGSTTIRWRSGYFSGSVNIGGALTLTSGLTLGGPVTVGSTPSGYAGAAAAQDDVVIQGSGDVGLTFATDNATRTQTVAFGGVGLAQADAALQYSTSTRALTLSTLSTTRLTVLSTGDVALGTDQKFWVRRESATTGVALSSDSGNNLYFQTGTGAGLTSRVYITADPGHLVPYADDTQWLGAGVLRWKGIYAGNGAAATPSLCVGTTDCGLFYDTSGGLDVVGLAANGASAASVRAIGSGSGAVLTVYGGAAGAGGTGASVLITHNTSGSGAAGTLVLYSLAGTAYYLWVDSTGDLRIHTAPPNESGGDTSGTVVGAQS